MKHVYGIDLGTTYTKCAVVRPDSNELRTLRLDKSDSRQPDNTLEYLRSVVTVTTEGGLNVAYVGTSGWSQFEDWDEDEDPPYRRFEESKLWIGDGPSDNAEAPPWLFRDHDWQYRPEDIGALVLRKVKKEAEAQGFPPVDRIVVTHPQNFTESRREATRQAAAIAGLTVLDTLTEPDAAAIAFGRQASPGKYMVFDLGGGTLDITIVRLRAPRDTEVLTSEGIRQGGRDWDRRIFERMKDVFADAFPDFSPSYLDDETRLSWLRKAEGMKWRLNEETGVADPPARITLKCSPDDRPLQKRFELKRSEFEALTESLVDACRCCAEQALANKSLRWRDLTGILLVGGSTHLRRIRTMLEAASGIPLNASVDPSTVVAQGAALYANDLARRGSSISVRPPSSSPFGSETRAGSSSSVTHTGALARGLGVKAYDARVGRDVICNLIPKDTSIPHAREQLFQTTFADQSEIPVELWEGERSDPEECEKIGTCVLSGIPRGPAGQPVQVKLEVRQNGSKHVWVEAAGMSKEEVIQFDEARVVPPANLPERRAFIQDIVIR